MPKCKIQKILQEKLEHRNKLIQDWQNFLKKDIYLIFDEKDLLLETCKQISKSTRIF